MPELLELVRFVLFIVIYVIFLFGSRRLQRYLAKQEYMSPGRYFIYALRRSLWYVGFFTLALVLLAGYFNIWLSLLIFTALVASNLLMIILSWFLDPRPSRHHIARVSAVGEELGKTHPWVAVLPMVAGLLVNIAYPIAAGLIYFSLTGEQLMIGVFQLQIAYLLISAVSTLVLAPWFLTAPALEENTRGRYFVEMLGWTFSLGVWLAMAFWAFQAAPGGTRGEIGQGMPLQLSPLIVAILASLFICGAVVPYVIGASRGKHFRISLDNEQKDYVDRVISILRSPLPLANTSAVSSQLEELSAELFEHLVEKTKKYIDDQPDLQLGSLLREAMKNSDALTSSDLPDDVIEKVQPIVTADQAPRDLDQHYRYLRGLRELIQQVWQAKDGLAYLKGEEQRSEGQFDLWQKEETWRQRWLETFEDRSERLDKAIEQEQSGKPAVLASVSTVTSIVFGAFIDNIGGWVWELFQSSL